MNQELQQLKAQPTKFLLLVLAFAGLVLSFLLQRTDILQAVEIDLHPYVHFMVRKTLRVVINDLCMLLVIHVWFNINIDEYTYELPTDRIALFPLEQRDQSKLLVYAKGDITH